ncbi:site-specific integrase [Imperialibacter roseus]|uniref:Site-specific integrase n=1 Tax=Imperialibacter roseus TaxID=1324217 RepID=A0ABZ0IT89_9BACT|nr:site-specific integrase [Imperialibacter roseus]WOK07180.1 site-specific integrase [Imperialibacter roseus]
MAITLKYSIDTRTKLKSGKYQLRLRIIFNRSDSFIPTGFHLTKEEWDQKKEIVRSTSTTMTNTTRFNNKLAQDKAELMDKIVGLESAGKLHGLRAVDIKELVYAKPSETYTVLSFIDMEMQSLIEEGRVGTARTLRDLKNKLIKFHGSKIALHFADINYSFLRNLEKTHLAAGSNRGSLGVYMRTLRAIFNKAIKHGIVKEELYPFKQYTIRKSEPFRRALQEDDLKKIIGANLKKGSALSKARDFYLASIYLRGVNWMDMALMKVSNIEGDFERINYKRHKTGKPFSVKIIPQVKQILENLNGGLNYEDDQYLFPILKPEDDGNRIPLKIENRRRKLNKTLKELAGQLEIKTFTIYSARHTWATLSKRKGIPTAGIQEGLGHATEQQTQTYLDSFGNDVLDKYNDMVFGDL